VAGRAVAFDLWGRGHAPPPEGKGVKTDTYDILLDKGRIYKGSYSLVPVPPAGGYSKKGTCYLS